MGQEVICNINKLIFLSCCDLFVIFIKLIEQKELIKYANWQEKTRKFDKKKQILNAFQAMEQP